MNMKVPALSMLFMSFALLFSLAVPVLLFFWYRKEEEQTSCLSLSDARFSSCL